MSGFVALGDHVVKKVYYAANGFEAYGEDEINAVQECLRGGWLAGFGSYSCRFEERVSNIFFKKFGLFVNSGSSANLLALAALDLPQGSRIVTPACTFSTTVAPILQLGFEPVFIDVELDTYVPSVAQVAHPIASDTDKTIKVIMLPNLIGNIPDWKSIREMTASLGRDDIILIEDSADTLPSYVDSTQACSDIATTSFYASHVITSCGSGGMVMFNSKSHLDRACMYRDWGRLGNNAEEVDQRFTENVDGIVYDTKFLYGVLGYNFKSSEVNAAFGLVQLDRLNDFLRIRQANFASYVKFLAEHPRILLPKSTGGAKQMNWLAIPLQLLPPSENGENSSKDTSRLALINHLESKGIQTRVLFSGNVTRHPAYRKYLQEFPNADRIMRDGFLLGCHHGMTSEDVRRVCNEIQSFLSK